MLDDFEQVPDSLESLDCDIGFIDAFAKRIVKALDRVNHDAPLLPRS
ncbi:hypothetical protein C7S16_2462 [Burkholderia thailandensis]|uniref:Uncharacterized protein n=1 Tax=Burkholderia thailandensis TaxID=57975 RepID=A0AAW9D4A1_BURTH|nr:hypothetical protein [Burkholderia thailandensis]